VIEGGGPLLPTEAPHLTQDEIREGIRLSCQVKVRSDIRIEVSEEILNLQQYEARVASLTDLNYDTRLVVLDLVEPPEMEFIPGQYIQLETPPYGKTPEPVYRAYSIASSASEKGSIALVIRRVPNGICTTYVFEMVREGDAATINGPYGEFYLRDTEAEVLFVAGASGIAPIWSILHQMAEEGIARKATFFYGANELRDLYLVDEMREFEKRIPGFTFVPCVARPGPDDDWEGETGLVTDVMNRHVSDCASQEVYLCGSPAMIDAVVKLLGTKGLTEDRAFYDKFA
jgi:Na+-transporting NADH:ubiquinone oxidoreductase subunit F